MEKSLDFYLNAVNLTLDRQFSPAPHMEIAFLGSEGTKVELICDKKRSAHEPGKGISLGFSTDSVDLKMKELESKGIPVHEGPFQPMPSIRFFYVLDPNGVKIQFVEEKDAQAQS